MRTYTITDVILLLGLPAPPHGRNSYYISCPKCDSGRKKHLNINLVKNAFRCPRCGENGGIFDLYALYTGVDRRDVKKDLDRRFGEGDTNLPTWKPPVVAPPPVIESPLADIGVRDAVYRMIIERLSLAPDHKKNLIERGLSETVIAENQYRTSMVAGGTVLARQLMDNGCNLSGIPGFYRNKAGTWTFVSCNRGILVPVRNRQGLIQGIKVRLDNVDDRKYRWISSTERPDGCKAGGWVHVAGSVRECVLLTEGPMKADVIHHLTGQTVVAVPGVNALLQLEQTLMALKELGVRKIMTCFDMDLMSNFRVQKGYRELIWLIDRLDFSFGTYLWNPEYNGLDDYVWEYCMNQCRAA